MSGPADSPAPAQSDGLLWLGGAVVAGIGVAWLLLSQAWLGGAHIELEPPDVGAATRALHADSAARASSGRAAAARTDVGTPLEANPLRMAELAYDAGMLMEPEEYSAWALYQQALEQSPGSEAARRGLAKIADEVLKRAQVAVEQGRFDDALATIQRVRGAMPAHPGANDLMMRIDSLRPKPVPAPFAQEPRTEPPSPGAEVVAAAPAEEPTPPVDPLLEPHLRFGAALTSNRLLTPLGASAKHALETLIGLDPDHQLTRDALQRFSSALLARADSAIAELDAAAAETWLDEAARLDLNAGAVADARARLHRRLIETESTRRVPMSALVLEHYVPPNFPARALERSFEGWVDLDFTVGRDGSTRDIVVTDASHSNLFRREAVEALAQWRLQPRVYRGEVLEQRAYTRVRFVFGE